MPEPHYANVYAQITRLTDGFSNKMENLSGIAQHFMPYNFCRVHQTLRKTSAMATGLTKYPWTISDIVSSRGDK